MRWCGLWGCMPHMAVPLCRINWRIMTIVGIGETVWDLYGEDRFIGGAPANFASNIAQLGRPVALVSRVGTDRHGEELVGALRVKGVGTAHVQKDMIKATGRVTVKLKKGAIPSFCCLRDAAYDYLEMNARLQKLAERSEVVLFGNLALRTPVSRETIFRFLDLSKSRLKIFNFNYRARKLPDEELIIGSLRRSTVIKADKREWRILKRVLRRMDEPNDVVFRYMRETFGVQYICISLGRGGCIISSGNGFIYSPGFKIIPVDTVGAGDAFMAGFVDAYLDGRPLEDIAFWANAMGALVASKNGASPHFDRDELIAFIREHTRRVSIGKYKSLEF